MNARELLSKAFHALRSKPSFLPLFVVYDKPRDHPGQVIVRLWDCDKATAEHWTFGTVDEARGAIPEGLVQLARSTDDDPCIVEVWL